MKTKKNRLSLDSLALNKETVFNLSNEQMKNLVGGVTNNTELHCETIPGGNDCGHASIAACSINTHCYSVCEPNCTNPDTGGTIPQCQTNQECSNTCPM